MVTISRRQNSLYLLGLGFVLTIVAVLAMPTVTGRHFQVDEFYCSYNCRLLFDPENQDKGVHPQPYMAVLGYLTAGFEETTDILLTYRGIFFVLFLANLILAAHAQFAFPSRLGRWLVLLGFASLYPLWLFGLEIRHDNMLLTGNLALFFLTQRAAHRGTLSATAAFLGGVAVFWTFISAHKGFAYAFPYGALLVATHSTAPGIRAALVERARKAAWLVAGTGSAAAVTSILLAATGSFTVNWNGIFAFAHHLEDLQRFSHWGTTLSAAFHYPHLFALSLVFLVVVAVDTARQVFAKNGLARREGPTVHQEFPSRGLTTAQVAAIYLLWSFVVHLANPKPFPYNLLHLVPFVFFAAVAAIARLHASGSVWKTALATLALANGIGGLHASNSFPYGHADNQYQLGYIRAAEALTDPKQDSVLDGVGMVLTRKPPDRDWLVHSSFMSAYDRGARTSFTELLESGSSPVVMTNYRWSWFSEREWSTLRRRYVQLAKDFWVLGSHASGREGRFEIYREGRYFVVFSPRTQGATVGTTAGTTDITVDGRIVPAGAVYLARGIHQFTVPIDEGVLVSWAGPRLEAPLSLESLPRNRPLFEPF